MKISKLPHFYSSYLLFSLFELHLLSIKKVLLVVFFSTAVQLNWAMATSPTSSCRALFLSPGPSRYSVRADLEYSAGRVQDLYDSLPMVRLAFPPRSLHPSEVQTLLDSFILYHQTLTKVTAKLPPEEQIGFVGSMKAQKHQIQSFAKNYSSFSLTSLVQQNILYLSNQLKGASFEGLVYILLQRSGFDSIGT